jgi:hypothetical protein
MQPNTLKRWGYKGKLYVKNTRKKFMQDPKPSEKSDLDSKKKR